MDEAQPARGFVLQASYRVQEGHPVVHIYGMLEGGGAFLVRERRQVPHFHIRRADAARAWELGATRQQETMRATFSGERALRLDVGVPSDAPALRDRLEAGGIRTFEADVRFAVRYLVDRGVRGGCEIAGDWTAGERIERIYDDPQLTPAEVDVAPRVLSFDIETDPTAKRLLAIALYAGGGRTDEVLIVDPDNRPMPERATRCADEREALEAFAERVASIDPDILTGWNVIDFDLTVLDRIAKRRRVPLHLGRDVGNTRIRPARGYFGSGQASIPGRLVLDGMDLVRGAFMRFDDYSLDGVASEVLGEGKVTLAAQHPGGNRAFAIQTRYRDDLPKFAAYARTDARLALEIVEKLDLVTLAFARSRLTGMTPDRVSASIASFDFLYLQALRGRRIVAPTVRSQDADVSRRHQAGGYVFEPVTGMHDNVWVFDFKSLYPSVIRTFNIDPLGYAVDPEGDPVRLADDAAFRRGEAILPRMIDGLFPQREAAKRSGDACSAPRRAGSTTSPSPMRSPAWGGICCNGRRRGSRSAASRCSTAIRTAYS